MKGVYFFTTHPNYNNVAENVPVPICLLHQACESAGGVYIVSVCV